MKKEKKKQKEVKTKKQPNKVRTFDEGTQPPNPPKKPPIPR